MGGVFRERHDFLASWHLPHLAGAAKNDAERQEDEMEIKRIKELKKRAEQWQ